MLKDFNHELTLIHTNKKKEISVHSCSFVVFFWNFRQFFQTFPKKEFADG
jgi:hypothetical protein